MVYFFIQVTFWVLSVTQSDCPPAARNILVEKRVTQTTNFKRSQMMVNVIIELWIAYDWKTVKSGFSIENQVLNQYYTTGKQQSWDLRSSFSVSKTRVLLTLKLQHIKL